VSRISAPGINPNPVFAFSTPNAVASQHAESDDELYRHAARSSCDVHGRESRSGRLLNFTDDRKIFELLQGAHAPIEDHQIVDLALQQRRPGMVELRLTEEQYISLIASLRR
jgi:hypothetical protein